MRTTSFSPLSAGYQVAANITAVRLNAILTQPILLPPRLLKGRCSENCKTPNKMLLPTVKPDAVIAGRNPCACACDESCQKPSNFCICVKPYIDYMDVMVGTTRENEASTRAFLGSFTTLPLDSRIYEKAVTLRKEYWMRLPDAVICATARVHKLTLFTRDSKDFPVTDQDITVPYRL